MKPNHEYDPAFQPALLERSDLFVFFKERLKDVYRSPEREAVDGYGLIVVGGQALSLWARQYLLNEMTGEEIQFATSDDLDFIGRNGAVEFCEQRLNVAFRRADLGDHTPNLAAAEIAWDRDRKVVIDILESIAGVSTHDIYQNLESVVLDDVRIAIIDPISCLQSRLHNLYAPWCRDKQRESVRTKLAVRASAAYLQDVLVDEGYAGVRSFLKRLQVIAKSQKGHDVFYDYNIDILDAVPQDRQLMPESFFREKWPRLLQEMVDRRKRKERHYQKHNRPRHNNL